MGITIELLTNLFQSVMFAGFLYLFFEKPQGKLRRILPLIGCAFSLFMVCNVFTLMGLHTGVDSFYLDAVLCLSCMVLYCLLFLKGKIYLRIIMPLFAFGINALVSYSFSYIVSFFSGVSAEDFFTISSYSRYTALAVVNMTTLLLLWLALRLNPKKIQLCGAFEIIAFSLIPLLCMVILYCCMFVFQISDFNDSILIYLVICCVSMVIIAVLIYLLLIRISKANTAQIQLMLTTQREKLYEESILASNEQIEKIAFIKHDMKNKLSSLEILMAEGNTEAALNLCRETTQQLRSTFTPICTPNPTLNAIINVEMEKAASLNIDFSVDISDSMNNISSANIVSLIGNLCDNAIEYMESHDVSNPYVGLKIHSNLNFCVISCQNSILGSVLADNKNLVTSKEDNENHGKGLSIIKRIANEYNGNVMISEENGFFAVSVMLDCSSKTT